jgi:SAM-dependent methyltransferase
VFYKHNKDNFFKDRHYIAREFDLTITSETELLFVEFGCGVGNALIPLVEEFPTMTGVGVDCSKVAIELMTNRIREMSLSTRCTGKVVDLTSPGDSLNDIEGKADFVSLIFALSACSPHTFTIVRDAALKVLKPGGTLLIRDYAKYDLAQIRLAEKQSKLGEDFYVRGDNTRAKFFTEPELRDLFDPVAECLNLTTHARIFRNRKTCVEMQRLWVQGKWRKPQLDVT